jgi:hypothetical protein
MVRHPTSMELPPKNPFLEMNWPAFPVGLRFLKACFDPDEVL